MTRTTLRRRGPSYRVHIPPSQLCQEVHATDVIGWDWQADALLYNRGVGARRIASSDSCGDAGAEVISPGTRVDVVATLPRAQIPFSDPLVGADHSQIHESDAVYPWQPYAVVHAIESDPTTGRVIVWWHRTDEWDEGDATLRVSTFGADGTPMGATSHALGTLGWTPAIHGVVHQGTSYSIEPSTLAPPSGFAPLRIVQRNMSSGLIAASWDYPGEYEEPVSLAIDVDPVTGPALWVFETVHHLYGTGPYPGLSGSGDGYDVGYWRTVPMADVSLGPGARTELTFPATISSGDLPWSFAGIFDARGQLIGYDGREGDGSPRFITGYGGANPSLWPPGGGGDLLQTFKFALTDPAGTWISEAAHGNTSDRGRLYKVDTGEYVILEQKQGVAVSSIYTHSHA